MGEPASVGPDPALKGFRGSGELSRETGWRGWEAMALGRRWKDRTREALQLPALGGVWGCGGLRGALLSQANQRGNAPCPPRRNRQKVNLVMGRVGGQLGDVA